MAEQRRESWRVRQAIAQRPDIPDNILAQLSHDRRRTIRETVAKHPNVPVTILATLTHDIHKPIRYVAEQRMAHAR